MAYLPVDSDSKSTATLLGGYSRTLVTRTCIQTFDTARIAIRATLATRSLISDQTLRVARVIPLETKQLDIILLRIRDPVDLVQRAAAAEATPYIVLPYSKAHADVVALAFEVWVVDVDEIADVAHVVVAGDIVAVLSCAGEGLYGEVSVMALRDAEKMTYAWCEPFAL